MSAPLKNAFYKLVKMPTGRPNAYTPAELWQKAQEYFQWAEENPLQEDRVFSNGTRMLVDKMRAMTEREFCLFAGIDRTTFNHYKSGQEEYKDFFHIAGTISDLIYCQKFTGAAADLLNPNLIARDLALKESTAITFPKVGKDLADETYV